MYPNNIYFGLNLKYSPYRYFGPKVYTVWVHGSIWPYSSPRIRGPKYACFGIYGLGLFCRWIKRLRFEGEGRLGWKGFGSCSTILIQFLVTIELLGPNSVFCKKIWAIGAESAEPSTLQSPTEKVLKPRNATTPNKALSSLKWSWDTYSQEHDVRPYRTLPVAPNRKKKQ